MKSTLPKNLNQFTLQEPTLLVKRFKLTDINKGSIKERIDEFNEEIKNDGLEPIAATIDEDKKELRIVCGVRSTTHGDIPRVRLLGLKRSIEEDREKLNKRVEQGEIRDIRTACKMALHYLEGLLGKLKTGRGIEVVFYYKRLPSQTANLLK